MESHEIQGQYSYAPLRYPKSQFRLMKIISSTDFDLATHDTKQAPAYLAISYAWGEARLKEAIKVNGNDFFITHNARHALAQAVPAARKRDLSYIWMDSVCINQSSLGEKNEQVSIMGTIFETAHIVCACIGPHGDGSKDIFTDVGDTGPENHERGRALAALLNRPYWRRLWVVQELALAHTRATILCGEHEIGSGELWRLSLSAKWDPGHRPANATRTLDLAGGIGRDNLDEAAGRSLPSSTDQSIQFDLFSPMKLILGMLSHQCADPRDRVYGILGLAAKSRFGTTIVPDYNATRVQIACHTIEAPTIGPTDYVLHMVIDVLIALHHSFQVTIRGWNVSLMYWRNDTRRGLVTLFEDLQQYYLPGRAREPRFDRSRLVSIDFEAYVCSISLTHEASIELTHVALSQASLSFASAQVELNPTARSVRLLCGGRHVGYAAEGTVKGDYVLQIKSPRDGGSIVVRTDEATGTLQYVSTPHMQDEISYPYIVEASEISMDMLNLIALGAAILFKAHKAPLDQELSQTSRFGSNDLITSLARLLIANADTAGPGGEGLLEYKAFEPADAEVEEKAQIALNHAIRENELRFGDDPAF